MNLFDILLLFMILACFGGGLRSGLIKQFFSLTAIIGGVALGFFFYGPLGAILLEKNIIAEPRIADILGFLIVASLAYMLIHYLSHFLTDLLEKVKMGWINHLLGGAMGFIVGLLLCYLLVTGVKQFVDEDAPFIKNSVLAPKVISGYQIIREQAPDDLDESLEKLRELREGKQGSDFE
ncbi:MAG: CvpA family protein [Candidatus Dadabacteria bacterium]|nr:CvpA family protein [Candidatus Dadabacteria bacterium]MDE0663012.1 CvpA family protein [Candidatus Dadabacteria bacterium]